MPEIMKKPNGDIDYQKLFMGFAVALVFVMQQWHAMQLSNIKAEVVPRKEYQSHVDKVMAKDDILTALTNLSDRLDAMEESNGK